MMAGFTEHMLAVRSEAVCGSLARRSRQSRNQPSKPERCSNSSRSSASSAGFSATKASLRKVRVKSALEWRIRVRRRLTKSASPSPADEKPSLRRIPARKRSSNCAMKGSSTSVARATAFSGSAGGGSLTRQAHPGGDRSKKNLRPTRKRELVEWVRTAFGTSLSRACRLVWISRSLQAYRSRRPGQEGLRVRMRELAQARPRYGYRRLHVLLRRDGWAVNMKRVRRLY